MTVLLFGKGWKEGKRQQLDFSFFLYIYIILSIFSAEYKLIENKWINNEDITTFSFLRKG